MTVVSLRQLLRLPPYKKRCMIATSGQSLHPLCGQISGLVAVFRRRMKAFTAVLLLGLLCAAEARWELRWHFGRNLLQVTPLATQPTAATTPTAAQNGAAVQPQTVQTAPATGVAAPGTVPGAVAAQPAAVGTAPTATDQTAAGAVAAQPAAAATAPTATDPTAAGAVTAQPAAAATAPTATDQGAAGAVAAQPAAAGTAPTAAGAAAAQPAAVGTAPTAGDQTAAGAAAAQPAAAGTASTATDQTVPASSPQLTAYQGRQGVYVIADPAPPPRVPAAPAAANRTTAAAGPPALAAGNNLIVVFTVMGEDAKTIYKNQQELRSQVATAAGVSPSQVLFYNQTANQDPRTGVTALSLSMAVDCGNPAVCARAGSALQNTTSQTKLSDRLAREGISVMIGTFQVYGVNSFGRYKGNDTLYEDKNLFAPKAATALSYNETMARFGNASAAPGALPGALPGMPLGNFSIPGFSADNTSTAGGMQPGFNLSAFQIPQAGLLPAGATPLGNESQAQQQPAAPLVRSSASGIVAGAALPMLLAALAAVLV